MIDNNALNVWLRALADEQRRAAISFLRDEEREVSLSELAEAVAAHVGDEEVPRGRGYGDLRTTLYHVHLPKLADAGLIEWDPAERVARYRAAEERHHWPPDVE